MERVEKSDRNDLWLKSVCKNERESLQDGSQTSYVFLPGSDGIDWKRGGGAEAITCNIHKNIYHLIWKEKIELNLYREMEKKQTYSMVTTTTTKKGKKNYSV